MVDMETIDLTLPYSPRKKKCKVRRKDVWVHSTFHDTDDMQSENLSNRHEKVSGFITNEDNQMKPSIDDNDSTSLGNKMWIDLHTPQHTDDLAVHRNKITEVDSWIQSQTTNGSKVLVLTGPVGCGKTATVQVLASKYGLTCKEWTNPVITPYEMLRTSGLVYQSQLSVFHDFLFRSGRYASVLDDDEYCSESPPVDMIVLEELPFIFQQDPSQFKDILLKYQKTNNLNPLIVIASEGNMDATFRQLPPTIKRISFNSVASTLMVKALKKIASSEGYSLSNDQAKQLAANGNGDIRASIFSLQFLLQKSSSSYESKRPKKINSSALLQKDPSISIFRAIGKILYCKRQETKLVNTPPATTDPLSMEPEDVLDQCVLTGSTFASYLHHNYLSIFTKNDVCDLCNAAQCFSDSDLMSSPLVTVDPSHGASRMLDFYQGAICARGLITSNSLRKTHAACSKASGSFKPLHKPAWTAVSKERADNYIVAQSLFWKFRQSSSELIAHTLPYLTRLKTFESSPPERLFLQKVIAMSSHVSSSYSSSDQVEDEHYDATGKPVLPDPSLKNEFVDEDVEIEDFSD